MVRVIEILLFFALLAGCVEPVTLPEVTPEVTVEPTPTQEIFCVWSSYYVPLPGTMLFKDAKFEHLYGISNGNTVLAFVYPVPKEYEDAIPFTIMGTEEIIFLPPGSIPEECKNGD